MAKLVCTIIGGIISLIGFALVVIAFVYVERAKNPKGIMVYLLTGVGTNGFLVSAYPIKEKEAIKLKARYKK